MTLLSSLTNTELQSKNDIVNKLIDASIASNRNNGKTDINVLKHDIKNNNKNKNNNENYNNKPSNNAIKDHV